MITLFLILIKLCILGFLVMVVYAFMQSSDDTTAVVAEKTPLKLESMTDKEAIFTTEMPFRNSGKHGAAITDIFARPYLPQEQFKEAKCWANLELTDCRRDDNYFEALILDANNSREIIVTLHFLATCDKPMKEIMEDMVDMDVAIYISGVGRKAHYTKKVFFTVFAEDIKALVGGKN